MLPCVIYEEATVLLLFGFLWSQIGYINIRTACPKFYFLVQNYIIKILKRYLLAKTADFCVRKSNELVQIPFWTSKIRGIPLRRVSDKFQKSFLRIPVN